MIKKYLSLLLCIVLTGPSLVAQSFVSFPFSGYDEDATIQIGFQYNFIKQNYQLTLKNDWKQLFEGLDTESSDVSYLGELKGIHNKSGNGFSIGVPIDIKMNDKLSINFVPSFNILNAHQITYKPMSEDIPSIDRKSKHILQDNRGDNFNAFEFPVSLKLRSEEKSFLKTDTKYKAYVLGGIRLSRWSGILTKYRELSLDRNNDRPTPDGIILKPEYMSWEAGVGFEVFLSYFKVTPEIRFSQSMGNVLSNGHVLAVENKFMAPLDRALVRNVYFSLIFQ